MEEISIIQDFCSDILCCPWISEETMNHLALSAILVEDEINLTECSTLHMTTKEHADYIRRHISVCSSGVMNNVYFLLVQMANILDN